MGKLLNITASLQALAMFAVPLYTSCKAFEMAADFYRFPNWWLKPELKVGFADGLVVKFRSSPTAY
jgi:hypothetical protein